MTKKKSLKTALLMSGISMLLCGAMLAGTTFAWFSDTATSGENTIVAGNLHVALEYNTQLDMGPDVSDETWAADPNWENASSQKLFDEAFTWEPGAMLISTPFRVKNTGNLALDYEVTIACTYNSTDDGRSLEDVVQMKVVKLSELISFGNVTPGKDNESGDSVDRTTVWGTLSGIEGAPDRPDPATGILKAQNATSDALVAVLFWAPQAEVYDNKYNNVQGTDGQLLSIKCKISVYAKQAASESDSVGPNYDKDATYPEKA